MRRQLAAIISILMLAASPATSTAHAGAPSPLELVGRVNDFRAANDMPPLAVHESLMTAAQRHADWLAANHAHSHLGEGGSRPQDRANAARYQGSVSENVASGTIGYATQEWAMEGWAGSTVHRQTMLSQGAHIGAGTSENDEETYYVLLVGRPSGSAPVSTASGAGVSKSATGQPAAAAPMALATPGEDGSVIHTVQEGQTAWTIAAWYGVPLDELLATNQLGPGTVLHPGDKVIVRVGTGQTASPSPAITAATSVLITTLPVEPSPAPDPLPDSSEGDGFPPTWAVITAGAAVVLSLLGLIVMTVRRYRTQSPGGDKPGG